MSYNSEDYFLSNEFKSLLKKFEAGEDGGAYAVLDPDELMDVAEYYYNNGDRQHAIGIIDNTLSVYPGSAPPLLFKARIALLDDNDIQKAEEYTEMIEDKFDLEYFYMKAEIMLYEGKNELADQYLEDKFLEIDDDDKDYFAIDSAALFFDYGVVDLAEQWLKRSEDTDCAEYKEQAARIFMEKGEYEESKKLLNELIDSDPFSIHYWNALASSQFFNNNIEDSIQSSEYSIAINPDNAAALLNKANGLYNLGNFKEALEYYKRYNKQSPNDENGEMLIGFCHLLLDEFDEAIEHFRKAEQLILPGTHNLVDIYKDWSFALCRLGRLDESIKMLDKAKELDSDPNDILVYKGNLLLGSGHAEEAKSCFIQALRGSGSSPEIFMKIAVIVFESGDSRLAYKMFNMLLDKNYDLRGAYACFAACCYDLGKKAEFLYALKKALDHSPFEVKTLLGKLFPDDMQPKDYYKYMLDKMSGEGRR